VKKSLLLLLCLALVVAACGGAAEETVEDTVAEESETETLDTPATTAAPTLDKITFGFVPSAEQAELLDNIQPLMKVLSDGLGIEVEGFVTSDYSGLLVAMGSGQADIGAFNTLGYVNALNAFPKRLEAIAKVVRYGSGSYHGTFWTTDASICNDTPVIGAFENIDGVQTLVTGSETTPPDVKALQVGWGFGDSGLIPEVRNIDGADVTVSPGYACEADLSVMLGEEVLFVEEGSTSGYLYPSLQLKNAGIDYKNDITQVFAGSHDGVIAGLYNGDAKFGVSYDDARRTLRKTNPDVGEKVIAFSITAEIPNDVVAVRSDLPADVKEKIYTILSDYISTDEGQAVMDEIYGWTDIVPAVNSEFDVVKQAAEEFGLYDE
jgi:phosphonate transport system substrate-binding protein|tara:strand:+ start:1690 stop:2823 length:1134 start_codon:yes stop_codon:yes gene_type:complete